MRWNKLFRVCGWGAGGLQVHIQPFSPPCSLARGKARHQWYQVRDELLRAGLSVSDNCYLVIRAELPSSASNLAFRSTFILNVTRISG